MRKLLFILLLFSCVKFDIDATTYYISPTGSDVGGTGSLANPWKTLHTACVNVTTSGDIIHVLPGTYTETLQSTLAVGVSIVGEGTDVSIINSTYAGGPTILGGSAVGTNGNQTISYIRMGGGLVANSAIRFAGRSNVKIHHCYFINFFSEGVVIGGNSTSGTGEPATLATGIEFYNNTLQNCADYAGTGKYGNGLGNLGLGGLRNPLIHDNIITQPDRGTDANGYCVKFQNEGYLYGAKFYNNTFTKPRYDGSTWDFAMELWHSRGGIEIYNNTIQGGIDIAGGGAGGSICANDAGGYGFAVKIYNNDLGFSSNQNAQEIAIYLERQIMGGVYIYNNKIHYVSEVLEAAQGNGDTWEDVYFYNNVCTGINRTSTTATNGTEFLTIDSPGVTYDNVNFFHNVFVAGSSPASSCLRLTFKGTASNVTIRDNIIVGFLYYPIYSESCTINTISIENNIFYGNGTNAPSFSGCTITGNTTQNNLTSNPNYDANYKLNAGSPGIAAGIAVAGFNYDAEDQAWGSPPDIGAYKYGATGSLATVTTTAISDINITYATGGGNVTATGGSSVTAKGICWSLTHNPTTSNTHTTDGTGTGSFVSSLTGLSASTTYYVRAYAVNGTGTAYGSEVSFQTEAVPVTPTGRFLKSGTRFIKYNSQFVKR